MYDSLSFAFRKNHARDGYQIENLPWDSGKGICLWRQGKTCPAQAVHALSNETGTLIREDEKPLPFQAWGDVTAKHVLGDPEITYPKDAPDSEAQLRRVVSAKGLNVVATADSLARLRILDENVVVIDLVFRFNVPSCGGCPVPIQSCPNFLVFHGFSPFSSYRATGISCKDTTKPYTYESER
jgi:hypothetical protein